MCSAPDPPPPPPPPPAPPTRANPEVQAASAGAMQRARMASAGQSLLTGPLGLTQTATTAPKSLLGA